MQPKPQSILEDLSSQKQKKKLTLYIENPKDSTKNNSIITNKLIQLICYKIHKFLNFLNFIFLQN